jgi:hypothetical protein
MRSTEFDMIAMSLMALGVIFTCGVLLMIGYAKASRTRKPERPEGDMRTSGTVQASELADELERAYARQQ